MQSRQWADTLEDGDRKRRRQAEFLVSAFLSTEPDRADRCHQSHATPASNGVIP